MGLFNRLFGSPGNIAKELNFDEETRIKLWERHLEDYKKEEQLAKFFSPGNINNATNNLDELDRKLGEIEKLTNKDLINIENEEKLGDEILADLHTLRSIESGASITNLNLKIINESRKQEKIRILLAKIHDALKLKLHIIHKIRQRTPNIQILLQGLFDLIFNIQSKLYSIFMESSYFAHNLEQYETIKKITRAIILEQEFNEELINATTDFIKLAIKKMDPESSSSLRNLGERIFKELLNIARSKMSKDYDIADLILEVERIMQDDLLLHQVVLKTKGRVKLTDEQVNLVGKAFKEAYTMKHFQDLEEALGRGKI